MADIAETHAFLTNALQNQRQLEQDYNPAQAALIGAGAGFSGAANQGARIYNAGKKMLADRWGYPETSAAAQANLDALAQRKAEDARLYAPMQKAFPYETAFGEAAPALVFGPPGYLTAGSQAALNVSRRYIDELAAEFEKHKVDSPVVARLVQALRGW